VTSDSLREIRRFGIERGIRVLVVYAPPTFAELGCAMSDEKAGDALLTVDLAAGAQLLLVIDGQARDSGIYALTIE
jgi:hypothetical protein